VRRRDVGAVWVAAAGLIALTLGATGAWHRSAQSIPSGRRVAGASAATPSARQAVPRVPRGSGRLPSRPGVPGRLAPVGQGGAGEGVGERVDRHDEGRESVGGGELRFEEESGADVDLNRVVGWVALRA
jgi:hypothetical protein